MTKNGLDMLEFGHLAGDWHDPLNRVLAEAVHIARNEGVPDEDIARAISLLYGNGSK